MEMKSKTAHFYQSKTEKNFNRLRLHFEKNFEQFPLWFSASKYSSMFPSSNDVDGLEVKETEVD